MPSQNCKVKYSKVPKTDCEKDVKHKKMRFPAFPLIFITLACLLQYHYVMSLFPKSTAKPTPHRNLTVVGDEIFIEGKKLHILSGEIHYFRIAVEYWRDRLWKLKMAGLNTVSTCVEWSFHEPHQKRYNFTGDHDLNRFISTAGNLGLFVILKPGPHIGADRDLGGIPYWVLKLAKNEEYADVVMDIAKLWIRRLFRMINYQLFGRGGPVIMVQVEKQYGLMLEKRYISREVRDLIRSYVGTDALLYSALEPDSYNNPFNYIAGVLPTVILHTSVNVTSEFLKGIDKITKGPIMVSKYDVGWRTIWGPRYTSTVHQDNLVNALKQILEYNRTIHFNFYMFCGGTNFGFDSGAVEENRLYLPVATTYDYDAPLTEAGDPTPKYFAIRSLIEKYKPNVAGLPLPKHCSKMEYGSVQLTPCLRLLSTKGRSHLSTNGVTAEKRIPPTFEMFNQKGGLVLYETTIKNNSLRAASLEIPGVRDRAYVYLDQVLRGIANRMTMDTKLSVYPTEKSTPTLSLLVESLGRNSQRAFIQTQFKGILSPVMWDGITFNIWNITAFSMTKGFSSIKCELFNHKFKFRTTLLNGPILYVGKFQIPEGFKPEDTFFYPTGWGKGYVWVNGHNLGRYWTSAGPQITLYVPGVWLKAAPAFNKIKLLEMEFAPNNLTVEFIDYPIKK